MGTGRNQRDADVIGLLTVPIKTARSDVTQLSGLRRTCDSLLEGRPQRKTCQNVKTRIAVRVGLGRRRVRPEEGMRRDSEVGPRSCRPVTAQLPGPRRRRVLRRLKRFRGPLLVISSSPVHLHIPCFLDAHAVREEERHSTSVGRKVPAGYVRRSKFLPGDLTLPTMRNIYPVTSQWTGQVEK